MSDSPTREESSETIDFGFALKLLHLPELAEAETKRRRKKKATELSELAHAKKRSLQEKAQEMIQSNQVFRPDFLSALSQMALLTELARSEDAHSRVNREKVLPSNLVVKIQVSTGEQGA